MRIGVLTGGGDCPGLNAVIRAIVRACPDDDPVGVRAGWQGLLAGACEALGTGDVCGIVHRGGTILGTSRSEPAWFQQPPYELAGAFDAAGLDALVAIGGDGTLRVASALAQLGVPVVGVPKTIDNDIAATDVTFGFDTAVHVATEAIDRLHTTAESHQRVVVVEVMGRHSGWIALHAGVAGGADVIVVPERPARLAAICDRIRARAEAGRLFSIVVVAEGVVMDGDRLSGETAHVRLGGVGYQLAGELERRSEFEARATVLGHLQRGGTPTAFDRMLATRLGIAAADAVRARRFGCMTAVRGATIELVPLTEAVAQRRGLGGTELALIDRLLGSVADERPLPAGAAR